MAPQWLPPLATCRSTLLASLCDPAGLQRCCLSTFKQKWQSLKLSCCRKYRERAWERYVAQLVQERNNPALAAERREREERDRARSSRDARYGLSKYTLALVLLQNARRLRGDRHRASLGTPGADDAFAWLGILASLEKSCTGWSNIQRSRSFIAKVGLSTLGRSP